MSDTQALLSKIASLRQRLEQAQGLAGEAGSAVASLMKGSPSIGRLSALERQVQAGSEHGTLVDNSVRQVVESAGVGRESRLLPTQLTARARRLLQRGRELLLRLRDLGDTFALTDESGVGDPPDDPLALAYRETAALTDTSLRMLQTLPDAPSAQLRLCVGLDTLLALVARQVDTLAEHLAQRRREHERIDTLADLLGALEAGKGPDVQAFLDLAQAILDEASQAAPLRFLSASPESPARAVACHSLTVAQVIARIVRQDSELRNRPIDPVLVALVHDVGMLRVPAELLGQARPLDDGQHRLVESHCRIGAEQVVGWLPSGAWLAEATAGHHERLDGTGYPGGLRELQLSPLTRLLAVCDVYAALCAPRPHRPGRDPRTALTDTLLLAEQGALDRVQAERLLCLSFYPIGSVVELADGAVGAVIAVHADRRDLQAPARPVVALLLDNRLQPLAVPRYLDLAQCEGQSIVRTLPPAERRALLGRHHPQWL